MSNDGRIGCAVIGAGVMGCAHARVWAELPVTRLVAVYDVNQEKARDVAGAHGARAAASLEEAVSDGDVQIVSVCTPDNAHVEPCLAAAQAGKHVLVEKPLATCLADADRILAAANAAGVKLMVGHILRFDPRYCAAKDTVAAGGIGEIAYVYARRYNPLSMAGRMAAFSSPMFFLGIHDIDIVRWVTGLEIVRVFAVGSRGIMAAGDDGPHDAIAALVEFDNGAAGCIEALWSNPDGLPSSLDARLEVLGTVGRVDVVVAHRDVTITTGGRAQGIDVAYGPQVQGQLDGALRTQLEHFAWCVKEGREAAVSNEDARMAVAIAEAIHRSLDTGAPAEPLGD